MSEGLAGASANWIGNAAMTEPDSRPEPRWGQYSDSPPPPPPTEVEPTVAVPTQPVRRTGNIILTAVLLGIGLFDVVSRFDQFANFATVFRDAFEQLGYGEFASNDAANSMGIVQNVLRVVILFAAVVISIRLISSGKRAFWVPLAAGALAFVVLIVGVVVLMVMDPSFAQYLQEQSS